MWDVLAGDSSAVKLVHALLLLFVLRKSVRRPVPRFIDTRCCIVRERAR